MILNFGVPRGGRGEEGEKKEKKGEKREEDPPLALEDKSKVAAATTTILQSLAPTQSLQYRSGGVADQSQNTIKEGRQVIRVLLSPYPLM